MNNSLKIFLVLLLEFFFISNASADDYWMTIPSPVNVNLDNCFFIDHNTGWISGDSGVIIKTTNGGNSFFFLNSGITNKIESLQFTDQNSGWATALLTAPDTNEYAGTIILKTANGGFSWTKQLYPDTNVFLPVIYFTDQLNGYLGGYGSPILYTTNAGASWERSFTDSLSLSYPVLSIQFLNELTGFACGGLFDLAGLIWKTTDGGRNWVREIIGPEPFRDICILGPDKTYLSGGDFKFGVNLAKTTNNGNNWQSDFLGYFGVGVSIDFRTQYEGWTSLGFSGRFIYTLDSGNTWTDIYTPDTNKINDIQFTDSANGWAVGDNGMILKYNYTMSAIHSNNKIQIPNSIFLEQNYPNPFNPKTIINYHCSVSGFISLKVFNSAGEEKAALVNEYRSPGNYSVEFNAEYLPSGIYYYMLSTNGKSVTRKMVLIK